MGLRKILTDKEPALHKVCRPVENFDRKLHLLLDYSDRPGEVADPWYTGDFEATWRDVSEGCTNLLDLLSQKT